MKESEYLSETLSRYGLEGANAEFIRHNENLTYNIGGEYLLRIHKPKDGFSAESVFCGYDRTALRRTELELLKHLHDKGMTVQLPVQNADGDLVTILSDGTAATMLKWIEGRILDKQEADVDLCREIGRMIARIHRNSDGYNPAGAFRYDNELCCGLAKRLEADRVLTGEEKCSYFRELLYRIGQELDGKQMVYTHADLSWSNILLTKSGLVPIDFSLGGMCVPEMDLSAVFCGISDKELRRAILEGYSMPLDGRMLDATFVLNILLGIVLHIGLWTKEEWFDRKCDTWKREIFDPFLKGDEVIGLA